MLTAPWRWGGLVLLVGGLVGAVGGVVFLVADIAGAWLTVIAILGIGVGLLGLAAGFQGTRLREWARWLLVVAGLLLLLEFLFSVLANLGVGGLAVAGEGLPPLAGVALLVAAVMVFVDRAAPGAARWALLLPAVWSILHALLGLLGPIDSWLTVTIQDLLYAVAGALYLAVARRGDRS